MLDARLPKRLLILADRYEGSDDSARYVRALTTAAAGALGKDRVLVVTRFDERPSAVPGVSHQTLRLEPGTEASRATFTQTHYRLLARSVRFWSQHVHHAICMRLSLAYSCRVAARFAGWRYSFVSRNCEGWGRLSDRERQDLHGALRIVTTSSIGAAHLQSEGAQPGHIAVIPDPLVGRQLSAEETRPDGRSDPRFSLVSLGPFDDQISRATVGMVLAALRSIREAVPQVRYTLVDRQPSMERFRALAAGLGVLDCVSFVACSDYSDDARIAHCAAADVVVAIRPAVLQTNGTWQGGGLCVAGLAGLAAARPVIAARVGEQSTYVSESINGCLVDHQSEQNIAEAIAHLHKQQDSLGNVREHFWATAWQPFHMNTFARHVEGLLEAAQF